MSSNNSIITTLNLVNERFVHQLPIVFVILGSIGFIGDVITFLQPTLRSNTFCIYSLLGSTIDIINLFLNMLPNYIYSTNNILALINVSQSCKWKLFGLVFTPQLSMDLLILSLIDRYAGTCSLTSPIRHMRQLKVVPWLTGLTVIVSGLMSLYPPLLYDVMPGFGCVPTNPLLDGILYSGIHGLLTPFVMLLFVWLTYRNVKQSRERVGVVTNETTPRPRHQFIRMIFTQVIVTSCLVLQWIGFYIYFIITQHDDKSNEKWAIDLFCFNVTNTLYYLINVKSFYLSTLTSRLFRQTLVKGLFKLMGKSFERRLNATRTLTLTNSTR